MGLWANRSLIVETCEKEGIKLVHRFDHDMGTARTRRYYDGTIAERIVIIPLFSTVKTLMIFAHELGHHKHPDGTTVGGDVLTRELSAWLYGFAWLRAKKIQLDVDNYANASRWIYSYFCDESTENQRYYLDIFNRLWVKYYLTDSKLMKEIRNGKV